MVGCIHSAKFEQGAECLVKPKSQGTGWMTIAEKTTARATQTQRKTRIQREKEGIILDAALEVFSTRGFAGTTVDQVAAAAGMSKPNLLYYFASKEEVYRTLLDLQLDDWVLPLDRIREDGEPLEELRAYIRRKLELSRQRPRESRLYAMEIIQGAPHVKTALYGQLRDLVAEKAAVIQGWINAGRMAAIDPTHLIFAIWATTQHYADFDAQTRAISGAEGDVLFDTALKTLETLLLDGLRVR